MGFELSTLVLIGTDCTYSEPRVEKTRVQEKYINNTLSGYINQMDFVSHELRSGNVYK